MKRLVLLVTGLLLGAATATVARAQDPMAAPMGPMMPMNSPMFREMATVSDTFEIQSSRLALARSHTSAVRAFARHMIHDHTMTSAALRAIPIGYAGPPQLVAVATSPGGALDARRSAMLSQ